MTEEQKTILADATALAETPVCHYAIEGDNYGVILGMAESTSGDAAMYLAIQAIHRDMGYNW